MFRITVADFSAFEEMKTALIEYLLPLGVSPQKLFDSKLVLSELVGNVLRHSAASAEVEGRLADGFIELCVKASDGFVPKSTAFCSCVDAESGRGLFLVDSVSCVRTVTADGKVKVLIKL